MSSTTSSCISKARVAVKIGVRRSHKVAIAVKPRPLALPVYPADGRTLLGNLHALFELERVSAYVGFRMGLDPGDVQQMAALRIWKRNPAFCSATQWKAYCMRTSRSICASEYRRRYSRPSMLPLHAEEEFTGFAIPVEELAALKQWKEQRAEKRSQDRSQADLALLDLMKAGYAGTTPTEQKILQTILSMGEEGNFLKVTKGGRCKVKQSVLGEALGVSQGTVSRNLDRIREKASVATGMVI